MEKSRKEGKHAIIKNNVLFVDHKPIKPNRNNEKKPPLSAEEDPGDGCNTHDFSKKAKCGRKKKGFNSKTPPNKRYKKCHNNPKKPL